MDVKAINAALIEEFRANHGALTGRFENSAILLLTTTGARTGRIHTTPMMYTRYEEKLLVYASNAGAPKPPDWYANLRAHPRVTVEIGPERYEATARVTQGAERERLFTRTLEDYPFFAEHQEQAGRQIPVVALDKLVTN
jgi:deazaflavin-dependent oxidoreductase (nitroreductase family)